MPLFDDISRSELRLKKERESTFDYYNSSARVSVRQVRTMLESWFERVPETDQIDVAARFRSPIETQHQAAFFEIYLCELLTGMKFSLEAHPDIAGQTTHPDYLAVVRHQPTMYVEATLASAPSAAEAGARLRLDEVFDGLNKIETEDYFIEVRYHGAPSTPPSTRKIRKELADWLATLNFDSVASVAQGGRFDDLPTHEWAVDGLSMIFRPIPKSPSSRGKVTEKPVGLRMGGARWLTTDRDIYAAIESKAKKYGPLELPLILAINVVEDLGCDRIDIMNALFGSETITVTMSADGPRERLSRAPNGALVGTNGPRSTYVSAVLIASSLNPYSVAETPLLVHNPYAANPLAPEVLPLPQLVPNVITNQWEERAGTAANEFLRLPDPWPPQMD